MFRSFEAGVTTIQSHPHVEHLLAVGSYDDHIRLFDVRNPLRPVSQMHVGGGVWRAKWHPSSARKDDLLLACMYAGCKVVKIGEETSEVVKSFEEHKSIAYGADWSFAAGELTKVATCSFYDHSLYVWDA